MVSPKIHVVGAGNIGALVAASLRHTIPPAYATFLLKSRGRLDSYHQHGSTVRIETAALGSGHNYLEVKVPAEFPYPFGTNGEIEDIENLIVTTKAHQTVAALKQIAPAISPSTNILLLQNGIGIYDEIVREVFPDAGNRPKFSLGIATHGVHRTSVPWNFKHVGIGSIRVAEMPSAGKQPYHLQANTMTDSEESVRSDFMGSVLPNVKPTTRGTTRPTDSEEAVKADYNPLKVEKRGIQPDPESTAIPTEAEACAKSDYGDPLAPHGTPRNPIFESLERTGGLLNAQELPYPEFLLLQFEKMVVNAVINPLTAIFRCRNGELLHIQAAQRLMHGVINESAKILKHRAERLYSPDTVFLVNAALAPEALLETTKQVCKLTAKNQSSMLADVLTANETEVDYINGYLVRLAHEDGLSAIYNTTLVELVKSLVELNRKHERDSILGL
ncbi:2-dehydropantoate 2-reductase [Trichomonascus vanleenenianus]|uniref:Cbs2p n=1 Tax=Trichomonascus vanleenenianus TaxID=2268995 RepID=UPI003ECBA916